jgi:hypothetical protein
MDATRVLVRNPDVVEAEVDGQRVLMSPKDFSYFGLVDTGALVWDRIDGQTSLGDLVSSLATEFEAEPVTVETDVTVFVSALDSAGLLADA